MIENRHIAFVVGNGTSRQSFNLNDLRKYDAPILGCNALYRDFDPDYLVAIDDKIIEEIKQSEFPAEKLIVPEYVEQFEAEAYHKSNLRPRSNAGTNCILELLKGDMIDNQTIFCLGFDFLIADPQTAVNNVYNNTNGYEMDTRASYQDSIARCAYLQWICNSFSHVNFVFLFPRKMAPLNVHQVKAPNIQGSWFDVLDTKYRQAQELFLERV